MARARNKTTENNNSVAAWIKKIPDAGRRNDVSALIGLFEEATGDPAKMWGSAIVGFGSCHYVYDSGREGDMPLAGLASRSNAIALYLSSSFENRAELLGKMGKHKTGKACIYIRSLADIDQAVLKRMVGLSARHTRHKYAASPGPGQ